MKTLHIYIVLFCAVLIFSCAKKKYPDTVIENTTIYKFYATIGNTPVSIAAGINNYYMYASYEQDSNNVYNFVADLKELNCSNCANSVKIQINDFKVSAVNAPLILDSTFYPHSYSFLGGIYAYQAAFKPFFNKTASAYAWDFGDGTFSTDSLPTHAYAKAGNYNVKLKISSYNGCESTIYQNEKINIQPDNYLSYITATDTIGNAIRFGQTTSGGRQPYQYLWNFGDGTISSDPKPLHAYAIRGSYPVSLRVTDGDGEMVTTTYNAVTQNDLSSCAANYDITSISKLIQPQAALALSKVIITWTDAGGVVYTSNNELQPANSHFAITAVEDGGVNEKNEPIKKLHITFNCSVYNGSKALVINNAAAVISVAYK
jgi:PKD repeat protein